MKELLKYSECVELSIMGSKDTKALIGTDCVRIFAAIIPYNLPITGPKDTGFIVILQGGGNISGFTITLSDGRAFTSNGRALYIDNLDISAMLANSIIDLSFSQSGKGDTPPIRRHSEDNEMLTQRIKSAYNELISRCNRCYSRLANPDLIFS